MEHRDSRVPDWRIPPREAGSPRIHPFGQAGPGSAQPRDPYRRTDRYESLGGRRNGSKKAEQSGSSL